jgi:holliday junction DNA helicase RuvB
MIELFSRWRKKAEFVPNTKYSNKPLIGKKGGLFDDDEIIGFEDVKNLFYMAIGADKPLHLLLVGPPASAKSLFMTSLTSKLDRSFYAVGNSSTKCGIFDYLFEHRPRYLIIDEIEKMNKKDQASLLNLMESGIITELKHRRQRSTQLKTWVFASCNSTGKILPPLLTRFQDIHFKPYTEEEFVDIAIKILDKEEGIDSDIATIIAKEVFNRLKSANIRECVRIARLTKNDISKVQLIIDTFERYAAEKYIDNV